MEGIALSLGLDKNYFRLNYTLDPTILFRIFHYPSDTPSTLPIDRDPVCSQTGRGVPGEGEGPAQYSMNGGVDENGVRWGVGEHTDYGLLTLLAQDDVGGLQVR